ncbi:hypothetical protein PSYAC_21918 [Pseudomonas syringae pv. actinidiae str. M302091]|nr:hypothetical protein PSYAC_21918 [Pseudomonas syringae pv. actinidiae str. M302091]RMU37324.1 hypothetical protein ALP30_200018 [Pseudomonas syringae pv. primulae]
MILSIFGATCAALGDDAAFQHIWQRVDNLLQGSKYHRSVLQRLLGLFASMCNAFL